MAGSNGQKPKNIQVSLGPNDQIECECKNTIFTKFYMLLQTKSPVIGQGYVTGEIPYYICAKCGKPAPNQKAV